MREEKTETFAQPEAEGTRDEAEEVRIPDYTMIDFGYPKEPPADGTPRARQNLKGYIEELRAVVGSRRLITVGVAVVVLKEGAVLLELRSDSQQWGLPGGFKELGESLEDTARRELLEETGLTARTLKFLTVCSGSEFAYTYPNGDCIEQVTVLYQAGEVEGDLRANETENLELRYFDVHALPSHMQPLNERLLGQALEVLAIQGGKEKTLPRCMWVSEKPSVKMRSGGGDAHVLPTRGSSATL